MMPELVEREREIAALARAARGRARGRGARRVLIEGPAGIGKSALLAEARRRGRRDRRRGARRARLRARARVPVRRRAPAVRGAWWPTRRAPSARWPARRRPPRRYSARRTRRREGDVSFAALHGLFWVALNLAAERPLVLAIDDLHWCDRPSLRFVAYLARRLEGQPILVAATVRTGEPGTDVALLGEIAHDPPRSPSARSPLSAEAVRELVRERLGRGGRRRRSAPPATAPRAATRCSCASCSPRWRPITCGPTPRTPDVVLEIGPRAVSRTVIMRLARLSEDAIAVARAVAVLGESATLPAVAALTGLERGAGGRRHRPARARRDPAAARRRSASSTRSCATPSTRSCRSASASCSTSARRACCWTPARPPSRSPRTCSRRRAAGRSGWRSCCARRAGRRSARGAAESGVAHLRRALEEPAPAGVAARAAARARARRGPDGRAGGHRAPRPRRTRRSRTRPRRRSSPTRCAARCCSPARPAEGAAFAERGGRRAAGGARGRSPRRSTAFYLMAGSSGSTRRERCARSRPTATRRAGAGVGARMLAAPAALWWAYTGGHARTSARRSHWPRWHGGELTSADNGLLIDGRRS